MDRAVEGEPGRIDAEPERIVDHRAVDIYGHQVGGLHLLKTHAVGIDQEAVMASGQAGRDMGVDAVIETEPVDQPVSGGQILFDLPVRIRSEEHTSELQSLMRSSDAVLCL